MFNINSSCSLSAHTALNWGQSRMFAALTHFWFTWGAYKILIDGDYGTLVFVVFLLMWRRTMVRNIGLASVCCSCRDCFHWFGLASTRIECRHDLRTSSLILKTSMSLGRPTFKSGATMSKNSRAVSGNTSHCHSCSIQRNADLNSDAKKRYFKAERPLDMQPDNVIASSTLLTTPLSKWHGYVWMIGYWRKISLNTWRSIIRRVISDSLW